MLSIPVCECHSWCCVEMSKCWLLYLEMIEDCSNTLWRHEQEQVRNDFLCSYATTFQRMNWIWLWSSFRGATPLTWYFSQAVYNSQSKWYHAILCLSVSILCDRAIDINEAGVRHSNDNICGIIQAIGRMPMFVACSWCSDNYARSRLLHIPRSADCSCWYDFNIEVLKLNHRDSVHFEWLWIHMTMNYIGTTYSLFG